MPSSKPRLRLLKPGEKRETGEGLLRFWRDDFVTAKKAAVKPKTIVKYTTAIDPYLAHVGEYHWPPTRFDVADYLYTVRERTSAQTAFIYWSTLRVWFNYIETAGGFGEFANPAKQIRDLRLAPQEPKPLPKGVPDGHIKTLFGYMNRLPLVGTDGRDRTMLRFIWRTGARSGEASALRRSQLLLEDQYALLSAEETKDKEARRLVFGKRVREALALWLAHLETVGYEGEWVFPSYGHRGSAPRNVPLTVSGTRRMFKRRCNQAGIPAYTVHELRHTFTKDALRAGKNPDAIRRQLGHSDMRMVLRYAQVFDEGQMDEFCDFGD